MSSTWIMKLVITYMLSFYDKFRCSSATTLNWKVGNKYQRNFNRIAASDYYLKIILPELPFLSKKDSRKLVLTNHLQLYQNLIRIEVLSYLANLPITTRSNSINLGEVVSAFLKIFICETSCSF